MSTDESAARKQAHELLNFGTDIRGGIVLSAHAVMTLLNRLTDDILRQDALRAHDMEALHKQESECVRLQAEVAELRAERDRLNLAVCGTCDGTAHEYQQPCPDCDGTGRARACETCGGSGFDPSECKVCGAHPDDEGDINHGRGCFTLSEDGGGTETPDECPGCGGTGRRESRAVAGPRVKP